MSDLVAAAAAWRAIVGDEHVIVDGVALDVAATATFATRERAWAIVRPASRDEVAEVLRAACRTGAALQPLSRGKSWGYGSRVPLTDRCALLDLGRLDRIVDYDERMAHVTVEPGVTFAQLYAFLRERGSPLYMSVPGTTPEASVLGNVLERGDGAGPLGDRFAHAWAMEVVLATGECIHTGMGRWRNARAGRVARWGVGPFLDGIFTQSGFGVVTQITIGLAPLPRRIDIALCALATTARLAPIVDALRDLRLAGVVRSPPALWSADKALALLDQYPWDAMHGLTPLADEVRDRLLAGTPFGRWNVTVALPSSSDAHGRALRALVDSALAPLADDLVWSGGAVDAENRETYAALLGVPHERSVAGLYWRKRMPVPAPVAPEADRCGLLWVTPAVPCDGAEVQAAVSLAEVELDRHGFERSLALVQIDERLVYLMAAVLYDRDLPGEDERARACHDRLLARFIERGLYPFRLGVQSMRSLPPSDDDSDELLRRLELALDPAGILAPGRYEPPPRGAPT